MAASILFHERERRACAQSCMAVRTTSRVPYHKTTRERCSSRSTGCAHRFATRVSNSSASVRSATTLTGRANGAGRSRVSRTRRSPHSTTARRRPMADKRRRCKQCGRMLGKNLHVCAAVEARGDRFCARCGSGPLSNKGYARYKKNCIRCDKRHWRAKERLERVRLRRSFGGKCQRCGYERCADALHFHHVHGRIEKAVKRGKVSLKEVREHPKRFALVCANCHIEIHHRERRATP